MLRKYPGYFVTLEGGEGCGKTYQMPYIVDSLRRKGLTVYPLREPGGTSISEQIRDMVHDLNNTGMHSRTETLLYQAARTQVVEEVVKPRLAVGEVVISDRFFDSTIAYQGYGYKQNLKEILLLIKYATGGLTPDLTVLLDLDPEIGFERKRGNGSEWNRMDSMPPEFYERVRAGYLNMASVEPSRWVVINADQKPEAVFADLSREIENKLVQNGFIEAARVGTERR